MNTTERPPLEREPANAAAYAKRVATRAARYARLIEMSAGLGPPGSATPPEVILEKERVLVMDAVSDLLFIRAPYEPPTKGG